MTPGDEETIARINEELGPGAGEAFIAWRNLHWQHIAMVGTAEECDAFGEQVADAWVRYMTFYPIGGVRG